MWVQLPEARRLCCPVCDATRGGFRVAERYPSAVKCVDPWFMPTCSRVRPTRAQVLEKRTRVVELTHSGLTDDEIAAELGYANRSGVWKARQRALNAQLAESVEELRTLETMRLDAMQDALWDAAMAGHIPALREIRRIIEARCRLLGLFSGKPSGKPGGPTSVVLPSFWDHMGERHPEDWTSCRCPGFLGDVDESENEWARSG